MLNILIVNHWCYIKLFCFCRFFLKKTDESFEGGGYTHRQGEVLGPENDKAKPCGDRHGRRAQRGGYLEAKDKRCLGKNGKKRGGTIKIKKHEPKSGQDFFWQSKEIWRTNLGSKKICRKKSESTFEAKN